MEPACVSYCLCNKVWDCYWHLRVNRKFWESWLVGKALRNKTRGFRELLVDYVGLKVALPRCVMCLHAGCPSVAASRALGAEAGLQTGLTDVGIANTKRLSMLGVQHNLSLCCLGDALRISTLVVLLGVTLQDDCRGIYLCDTRYKIFGFNWLSYSLCYWQLFKLLRSYLGRSFLSILTKGSSITSCTLITGYSQWTMIERGVLV